MMDKDSFMRNFACLLALALPGAVFAQTQPSKSSSNERLSALPSVLFQLSPLSHLLEKEKGIETPTINMKKG